MAKEIVCPGCGCPIKLYMDGEHLVAESVEVSEPKTENDIIDDLIGSDVEGEGGSDAKEKK
jgi:hypothetical protein